MNSRELKRASDRRRYKQFSKAWAQERIRSGFQLGRRPTFKQWLEAEQRKILEQKNLPAEDVGEWSEEP